MDDEQALREFVTENSILSKEAQEASLQQQFEHDAEVEAGVKAKEDETTPGVLSAEEKAQVAAGLRGEETCLNCRHNFRGVCQLIQQLAKADRRCSRWE